MGTPEKWVFVGSTGDGTYTWHAAHIDGRIHVSEPFPNLAEAIANAVNDGGFNPYSQHWVVQTNGRATHFRPGKPPVNLPAGETPKD